MKKYILYFFFFLITNFAFGQVSLYTFASSSGTYSSITGTNLYTGTWNDDVTTNVPIGFNFYFNGKNYSTCSVSTNGFITLGTTAPTNIDYLPISSTSGFEGAISAVGFNLSGNTGSAISYITQGTAPNRRFIVQFNNVRRFNVNGDAFSFQIRLNETSNTVEFIYGSFTVSNSVNSRVQVGLRGLNNNDFNNRSLTSNTSWNTATVAGTTVNDDVRLRSSAYPSSGRTFTWTPPPVCSGSPSVTGTKSQLYINSFQFVGVLNNTPAHTSGFSTGYENYTGITPAQQPQGSVINISASRGTSNGSNGYWKAWVDWNNDGDFDFSSEEVYSLLDYTTPSLTFGFIIPANQPVGNYRLRIATANTSSNFSPCATLNIGEFEDYLFTVVKDCSAKVVSVNTVNPFDGERCGPGSVRLSAKGTTSAVSFNWYDYDPNTKAYTYLATGTTYLTPSISSTKTYYVKAITNLDSGASDYCETAFYYPVVARIDPQPKVTFSSNKPSICGEDDPTLLVTAAGDKYQDVIYEKFDSGLGVFSNITEGASFTDPSNGNNISNWLNKPSPYQPKDPPYQGLSPALSSGYFGDNFAMMNTDIARTSTSEIIINHLVSNDLSVAGYLNLKIDFDLYYFSIAQNDDEGYLNAQYALDGGVWVDFPGFKMNNSEFPNPLYWQKYSYDIPINSVSPPNNLKVRFTMKSYSGPMGSGSGFIEGITAIDNIRIYGYKNITTPFAWSSATTTLYKSDCVSALGGALESTVCVKPTATELEDVNWALNASATFSNGCPAIGNYTVSNDTKTWLQPSIIDWNLGAQWKPASVPTIAKCVIVRTPVVLPTGSTGTHGLARSVIVKVGGKLTVEPKSSLTIQNYIKNEAAASDVLVESDANLIQNNNAAVNIGDIIVRRNANLKRLDYNLWGAPVTGQNVKTFSQNTLDARFYVYNEKNDYFDGLFVHNEYPSPDPDGNIMSTTPTVDKTTYNFLNGLGYGIRASNILSTIITNVVGEFKGVPNNGIVTVPVYRSPDKIWDGKNYVHGFNMISNPFPSTIDFDAFMAHGTNSAAIYSTAYFWTNTNFTPRMQGSKYPSNLPSGKQIINNYAVLNATGGVAAPYGADGDGVTDPIGSSNNCPTCKVPNKYITPGQGFIVKARNLGNSQVEFDNSIRTNNQTAVFFNRMSVASKSDAKDRFWLNLKTPLDFNTTLLVGYIKGATDNFEEDYDAELMVYAGDSFYSALDDKKLAIQGKQYPFNEKDVIALGTSFGLDGQYEISIVGKEGIFENGQNVYLKDNLTGIVANLSEGNYTFHANAGDSVDRFEIQYKPANSLDVSNNEKENLKVYQTKNEIVIDSPIKVTGVKIFDASGKLLYSKKENENKLKINSVFFKSGVYLVEVETSKGKEIVKILK